VNVVRYKSIILFALCQYLFLIILYSFHPERMRFVILSVCEGSHEILRAKALRMTVCELLATITLACIHSNGT